jgi:hypothetical protein
MSGSVKRPGAPRRKFTIEPPTTACASALGVNEAPPGSLFSCCQRWRFQIKRFVCLKQACGLDPLSELTVHVSDVLLECSRECARLSRESREEAISAALFKISARLFCAAIREAELVSDDVQTAPQFALCAGRFAEA